MDNKQFWIDPAVTALAGGISHVDTSGFIIQGVDEPTIELPDGNILRIDNFGNIID